MANDGLQQIMNKGVVISGNDKPVTQMGAAEGIFAFATWLNALDADGSVSFEELARAYCRTQGWELSDPSYRGKLQTPPDVLARDPERRFPAQHEPSEMETTSVRVTAPHAVVLDGVTPLPAGVTIHGPRQAVKPAPVTTESPTEMEDTNQ